MGLIFLIILGYFLVVFLLTIICKDLVYLGDDGEKPKLTKNQKLIFIITCLLPPINLIFTTIYLFVRFYKNENI